MSSAQRGISHWGKPDRTDQRLIAGYARLSRAMGDREAQGGIQTGWKVGANDPATQRRLGLAAPVVGPLWEAVRNGTTIDLFGMQLPGVEAELAIELARPISPDTDMSTALASVRSLATAVEVIALDQRFDDLESLVGGNFLHRGYAVAEEHNNCEPTALSSLLFKVNLNGSLVWEMPAGLILGRLGELLLCAAANVSMLGRELKAGMTILSGVVTPFPVWVKDGDRVHISGGAAGEIELRFTRGASS